MKDICALCLTIDRNLYLINQELWEVLIPLLKASNFSVFKLSGRVLNICWECKARLVGINSFRNMALTSLEYMINYWNGNIKDKLPNKSYSKLTTSHIDTIQVLNVKEQEHYIALGNNAGDIVIKKETDLDIEEMINTVDPLLTEATHHKIERNSSPEPGNTESSTAEDSNMDEEMECSLEKNRAEFPEHWKITRAKNIRRIKKITHSREELLRKKRENERKRYARIKNDPEKLAAYREKCKQKYLKERATGLRKTISEMMEQEKLQARKTWRDNSRRFYYKKKCAEKP